MLPQVALHLQYILYFIQAFKETAHLIEITDL
jgi:hypothetical protein